MQSLHQGARPSGAAPNEFELHSPDPRTGNRSSVRPSPMDEMLVHGGDQAGMPASERTVIEWVRAGRGVAGVAVSGCYIPTTKRDRDGALITHETDLLVFTPSRCLVIEVKGLAKWARSGALSCSANDLWHLEGRSDGLVLGNGADLNPFNQLTARVFALRDLIARKKIVAPEVLDTIFINGAVVLVPPRGAQLQLPEPVAVPRGCRVLLGAGPQTVHDYLAGLPCLDDVWSAETVLKVLRALDITQAITLDDLLERGFPAEADLPAAPRRRAESRLPVLAEDTAVAPVPVVIDEFQIAAPTHNRPRLGNSVAAFGAAVVGATLIAGAWHLHVSNDSSHGPVPSEVRPSSVPVAPEPAPEVASVQVVPPSPAARAAKTTTRPVSPPCYPLQPNC